MDLRSFAILFLLAAIWGASFMFMKVGAPVFGPVMLIEYRILFAALFLLAVGVLTRRELTLKGNLGFYAFMGVFNSAIPFMLFAYAAKTVDASMMSVLNSTSPMFGAIVGFIWLKDRLNASQMLGLVLGVVGVYLLVGMDTTIEGGDQWLGVIATLGASMFYGFATNYAKKNPSKTSSFASAHGSMWAGSLFLAPFVFANPMEQTPVAGDWGAVLALGIVCTGIAYVLYFKLIRDVGAINALTVTLLVPVFGIVWGALLLDEVITSNMIGGAAVVLLALALTSGLLKLPKRQIYNEGAE